MNPRTQQAIEGMFDEVYQETVDFIAGHFGSKETYRVFGKFLLARVEPLLRAGWKEQAIEPLGSYVHMGPTCGHVAAVPSDYVEPPPWCIHSNGTHVWRDPHPETQAGPRAWTSMVAAVVVRAALETQTAVEARKPANDSARKQRDSVVLVPIGGHSHG